MSSRVMKFGGSSLAGAEQLREVALRVQEAVAHTPLVVVSAMGKTTDALFAMADVACQGDLERAMVALWDLQSRHRKVASELFGDQVPEELESAFHGLFGQLELLVRGVALLRELSPRSMDAIASFGERLSSQVLTALLRHSGIRAVCLDVRQVLRTDAMFGEAQPQAAEIRLLAEGHLRPHFQHYQVVVTQGYIGATAEGITTTLGRGGSDYSAAILGAALRVSEVQIWTDVEGVMTCDPRLVPEAQPIAELGFAEAAELAAFGAKVLHPATIQPAVDAGIPVTVRSTRHPQGRYTTIMEHVRTGRAVTALATRGPVVVLTVTSSRMLAQSGFLARLFEVFRRHRLSVDLIATAEVSVSLTLNAGVQTHALVEELSAFATVDVMEDRAIVAIVGERLRQTPGVCARVFGALSETNVDMISMGATETNLSLVVASEAVPATLTRLHRALIEEAAC